VHTRRRRRAQRRAAWAVGGLAFVLVLIGTWAVVDATRVRGRLVTVQGTLQRTVEDPSALRTPEGRAAALAEVDGALVTIDDARHEARDSPVLSLLGLLPGGRTQRSGLLDLIDDASAAATAGRRLLAKVDELAGRNRLEAGSVPVESLGELQAELESGGRVVGDLDGPSGLWGPVGDARRTFDDLAGSVSRRLAGAADALGAARSFVGSGGSRRYLVALQNNAEMRDQGMVLSYVVIRFDDGHLAFERQGSVFDLTLTSPAPTVLPPGTLEVFGPIFPTQTWQSVNATADFALSGRAMADMYQQATGQPVDGVIAIDVPGLAGVLRAVGPVAIDAVAEPIGPDNVARLLLHDFYQGLPPITDTSVRRERLGEVVTAMVDRLTMGSHDAVTLGGELGGAASGGHLRLWSATPEEEEVFERTGLGGGPAVREADRTFHVAVENRTATKLDYFVMPSVRQEIRLTPEGDALVRTTVTIHNGAPQGAEPSYQLGPDQFTSRPGEYIGWVLLWAPAGSVQPGSVVESGLNLAQAVVTLGPGENLEGSFETRIPNAVRDGKLTLRLVPQPRLTPVDLDVRIVEDGGWKVRDATSWRGPWDRTLTFHWRMDR